MSPFRWLACGAGLWLIGAAAGWSALPWLDARLDIDF